MNTLASINRTIEKLKNELLSMDYILRGTISERYQKCGKKSCICHRDPERLHGPYYFFTKKIKGKTIGKLYSKEEADLLNVYLKKYNYTIDIIKKISELSDQAVQLLLKNIISKEKRDNDKNKAKRK